MAKPSQAEGAKRLESIEAAVKAGDLLKEVIAYTFGFVKDTNGDEQPMLVSADAFPADYAGKRETAKVTQYTAKNLKGILALSSGNMDELLKKINAQEASKSLNRAKLTFKVDTDKAFTDACENLAKVKRFTVDEARKILAPAFGK